MPEICRFYGIIIRMFFRDHLPPHFHVEYAEFEATVSIETGNIISGILPNKQERLVEAWVEIHREELMANYDELNKDNPVIRKIKPLE